MGSKLTGCICIVTNKKIKVFEPRTRCDKTLFWGKNLFSLELILNKTVGMQSLALIPVISSVVAH